MPSELDFLPDKNTALDDLSFLPDKRSEDLSFLPDRKQKPGFLGDTVLRAPNLSDHPAFIEGMKQGAIGALRSLTALPRAVDPMRDQILNFAKDQLSKGNPEPMRRITQEQEAERRGIQNFPIPRAIGSMVGSIPIFMAGGIMNEAAFAPEFMQAVQDLPLLQRGVATGLMNAPTVASLSAAERAQQGSTEGIPTTTRDVVQAGLTGAALSLPFGLMGEAVHEALPYARYGFGKATGESFLPSTERMVPVETDAGTVYRPLSDVRAEKVRAAREGDIKAMQDIGGETLLSDVLPQEGVVQPPNLPPTGLIEPQTPVENLPLEAPEGKMYTVERYKSTGKLYDQANFISRVKAEDYKIEMDSLTNEDETGTPLKISEVKFVDDPKGRLRKASVERPPTDHLWETMKNKSSRIIHAAEDIDAELERQAAEYEQEAKAHAEAGNPITDADIIEAQKLAEAEAQKEVAQQFPDEVGDAWEPPAKTPFETQTEIPGTQAQIPDRPIPAKDLIQEEPEGLFKEPENLESLWKRLAQLPPKSIVPDTHAVVGSMPSHISTQIGSSSGEVIIRARSLKHILERRTQDELPIVFSKFKDTIINPSHVILNPESKRPNSYLFIKTSGNVATVVEVMSERGTNEVVSSFIRSDRSVRKLVGRSADLTKSQGVMPSSEPVVTGSIPPFEGPVAASRIPALQPAKPTIPQPESKPTSEKGINPESGFVVLPSLKDIPAAKEVLSVLSPKAFVPREALDVIMKMKGERDRMEFVLEQKLLDIEKQMSSWKKEDQVSFIDRIKTGQPQTTPELQKISDMMRGVEDSFWSEAKKFKPSLAYKENHYRVLWKEIPGSKGLFPEPPKGGFKGLFRRPLQGTKGFMKGATLSDMSEGISMGGVPYSYNPMTMWKTALMDMQRFITAQRMWGMMKSMGFSKFIRIGEYAPDGFTRLDDRIAHVYFPVEEGLVHAGEWYVEENVARILNNFLSRDLIRESQLGKGLMAFKNITTSIELSLSPFHAAFESIETMASSIGLGLQKMVNRGLRQADPIAFLSGLKDIALSPLSPFGTASLGGKAIRFIGREDFINSKVGKSFIKAFPDAKELLSDLFTGGGQLAIHQDYKIRSLQAFQEGLKNKDPWAIALSAIPSANEMIMKPLFEVYIPRLKVGMFLREYSNELIQRKGLLESGELTRPQLARQVWDSVENRFGEMNFDNLFWNRTFKSSMQLVVRSVTWKLGSIRNIGGAIPEQIAELGNAIKNKRAPLLERNMAWMMGLATLVSAFGIILQRASGNGNPKDFRDLIAPRYDKEGHRISLNSYMKDLVHLWHSPTKYLTSSLTGEIGRMFDLWENKDFFNNQIKSPDDPVVNQMWDSIKYLFPVPFSISNYQRISSLESPTAIKAAIAAGIAQPAPGYINQTPAEEMAFQLSKERIPAGARTKFQAGLSKRRADLRNQYQKTKDVSILEKAVSEGRITDRQMDDIIDNADLSPLQRSVSHLPIEDVIHVFKVANPEEKKVLLKVIQDKRENLEFADTAPDRLERIDLMIQQALKPGRKKRAVDYDEIDRILNEQLSQ